MRQHELTGGAVVHLQSSARSRAQSAPAWSKPRAPRCIPSCSSHSPPHADVPMPIASVPSRPSPLSSFARKAGLLAAPGLTCHEESLDARSGEVEVLREVCGI